MVIMVCPSCGNENREGATFCDSCGTRLEQTGGASADLAEPASPAAAPLPDDTPRRVADHLEMVGFIGRGGRKDVYLARDERLGATSRCRWSRRTGSTTPATRVRHEAQAMESSATTRTWSRSSTSATRRASSSS